MQIFIKIIRENIHNCAVIISTEKECIGFNMSATHQHTTHLACDSISSRTNWWNLLKIRSQKTTLRGRHITQPHHIKKEL